MEVHAERIRGTTLEDNELTLFVRIGSDHRSNYYEYEVPLKLTPWGSADPQEVWPALNRVDIELDQLVAVKLARNAAMEQSESSVSFTRPFAHMIDGRQYFVCGNPNLGNIRTVMIGFAIPEPPAARPIGRGVGE
jgi:cell surface protein SprA